MGLFTILLSLIPGFAWLFFYLKEDLHPEPKKLIALTFLAGALFTFPALFFENFLNCQVFNYCNASPPFTLIPLSIVLFSLIEEVFKFGAAYIIVRNSPAFNEPVDAMIYAVVAGLGFATVENIGVLSTKIAAETALLVNIFETTSLRFIGATLLHSLSSAIAGYFWAISIREFGAKRFIFLGIALATGLHALFNFLIINYYGGMLYPVMLLSIAGFFVLNDFEKLKKRSI